MLANGRRWNIARTPGITTRMCTCCGNRPKPASWRAEGERRRLLDTVLSNCTFDRGTLCPTYTKPFDVLAKGIETGNWRAMRDEFRNWVLTAA
jgi:hypothetical protein